MTRQFHPALLLMPVIFRDESVWFILSLVCLFCSARGFLCLQYINDRMCVFSLFFSFYSDFLFRVFLVSLIFMGLLEGRICFRLGHDAIPVCPCCLNWPLPISVHLFDLSWALFWRNMTLALYYVWLELHLPIAVFHFLARILVKTYRGVPVKNECIWWRTRDVPSFLSKSGWPSGMRAHSYDTEERVDEHYVVWRIIIHWVVGSGRGFIFIFFFNYFLIYLLFGSPFISLRILLPFILISFYSRYAFQFFQHGIFIYFLLPDFGEIKELPLITLWLHVLKRILSLNVYPFK
jgi:hypothetical protein